MAVVFLCMAVAAFVKAAVDHEILDRSAAPFLPQSEPDLDAGKLELYQRPDLVCGLIALVYMGICVEIFVWRGVSAIGTILDAVCAARLLSLLAHVVDPTIGFLMVGVYVGFHMLGNWIGCQWRRGVDLEAADEVDGGVVQIMAFLGAVFWTACYAMVVAAPDVATLAVLAITCALDMWIVLQLVRYRHAGSKETAVCILTRAMLIACVSAQSV